MQGVNPTGVRVPEILHWKAKGDISGEVMFYHQKYGS